MFEECLKRKLTIERAEAKNMLTDERLGPRPVPFGFCNREWKDLLAKMQPGDELWEFCSSSETWKHLCGRAGIALVRNGKVVGDIIMRMS